MLPERRGEAPPEPMPNRQPKESEFDWKRGEIPESEVRYLASRGGGPGGQGVNTTDSRVELRWSIQTSTSLSAQQKDVVREYIKKNARKRIIEGRDELKFVCASERSQMQNKRDCINRLVALLREALMPEEERIATKKSRSVKAKERRSSEAEKRRKAGRGHVTEWD